jgi:hypothetical protein
LYRQIKKKPGRKPTGRTTLMALRRPPKNRGRIEEFAKQKGIALSKAI